MKINRLLLLVTLLLPLMAIAGGAVRDTAVRVGVLPNGLTYYLRHNAKTPKIADFYIAQRVGSVLEEPRQRGLAHFLEHMAFNGTEHFPGGDKGPGIVQWCESVGIKFGRNLNAYTSVDRTVYNISSAPVEREGVIDSCLLILHDWSHSLLLSDEEIDKERGVIHEEWRTRRAGQAVQRLMEDVLADVFKGSRYEDCLPIGSMEVVDNFPYKDLRDYYHKWYRPDLQAVIVVGDIDVDATENKIKSLFGNIPAQHDAARREYFPVNTADSTIVAMATDKEQPTINLTLYFKRNAFDKSQKSSSEYLEWLYRKAMITSMLSARLLEVTMEEKPPFVSASVRDGQFIVAETCEALWANMVCKESDIFGGLKALAGVLYRAAKHGFTASELERASASYLNRLEKAFNERNKVENVSFVGECLRNFLAEEPIMSREQRLESARRIAASTTIDDINATVRQLIGYDNRVITLYAPEKNGLSLPSANDLRKVLDDAATEEYVAYTDTAASVKLIENLPEAGSIVSEKSYGKFGTTVFKLSNGVTVYVKPTDFADDEITMNIFSRGGTSLYPDVDRPNFSFLKSAITNAGVGALDAVALRKALSGKTVKIAPAVGSLTESVKGSCSKKDFATMLELNYLYFTAPRRDEVAFAGLKERMKSFIANRAASPQVVYNDSTNSILYGDALRLRPLTAEMLDDVNYDRVLEIYKERFADASDFSMILVGNIDIDELRHLLCRYVASLPAVKGKKETFGKNVPEIRRVNETRIFRREQSTPSTLVGIYFTADVKCNAHNDLMLDVLAQVMRTIYTEKVREEKGGTYGVSVAGQLDRFPDDEATLKISFRTSPEKYDELIPIIYSELKNVAANGVPAEILEKVKKFQVKNYKQNILTNGYWDYVLYHSVFTGVDFDKDYVKMVESLTSADVKNFARKLLKPGNRIEVTMTTGKS